MTSRAVPLALTALLATGCGGDDTADSPTTAGSPPTAEATTPPTTTAPTSSPSPAPTTSSPSPTGDTRAWATCVSERASLQVSYPQGWTARDYPGGGCAYFDPQPFEVQRGTEAPAVAVRLDVESAPYDRVMSGFTEGEVLSQRETTVAGYPALRIENRDTGGPLGPKGHQVTYLADLEGESTLVLTTNETDADDFAQAQQVLDEMAQRLERTG